MANSNKLSVEQWHQRFRQQASWTALARRYLLEKAQIEASERILEVGCGTGAVLGELAKYHNLSFGIDILQEYLEYFRKTCENPFLTAADAYYLPFEDQSFDLVCCHYFMLWIEHPDQVIGEIHRVLKPGGRILFFAEPDYGARIDFPQPLEMLGSAQRESLKAQGADPEIGRKLLGLASAAGLINLEVGIIGYQSGLNQDEAFWENEWELLQYDLAGSLSEAALADLRLADQSARLAGSRILYVPTFYLYAEVP